MSSLHLCIFLSNVGVEGKGGKPRRCVNFFVRRHQFFGGRWHPEHCRIAHLKNPGIRKKVSVHTLRHTFGAHKADKNMSLATLQELMGHKKKETTLKYIHLAKTNLRQEMVQTAL